MVGFSDLVADLDRTVFAELSDDVGAVWVRPSVFMSVLPAMLDQVEQTGAVGGIALLDKADVVRVSVGAVELVQAGAKPRDGDQFVVNGAVVVVHGEPWRDPEVNGRDWLCPVVR